MILKYQCEICEGIYDSEEMALTCETFDGEPPKPKFKKGDTVKFDTRYETNQTDKIKEIVIAQSWFNNFGQLAIAKVERSEFFKGFVKKQEVTMHRVGYRLESEWQFGKGEYSDFIDEDNIIAEIVEFFGGMEI